MWSVYHLTTTESCCRSGLCIAKLQQQEQHVVIRRSFYVRFPVNCSRLSNPNEFKTIGETQDSDWYPLTALAQHRSSVLLRKVNYKVSLIAYEFFQNFLEQQVVPLVLHQSHRLLLLSRWEVKYWPESSTYYSKLTWSLTQALQWVRGINNYTSRNGLCNSTFIIEFTRKKVTVRAKATVSL